MSNEPPQKTGTSKHRTFFERLSGVFHTPTREDFIDTLHEANEQKLIDDSRFKNDGRGQEVFKFASL